MFEITGIYKTRKGIESSIGYMAANPQEARRLIARTFELGAIAVGVHNVEFNETRILKKAQWEEFGDLFYSLDEQ